MKKILLLSDTHSYMDERILNYAHQADEIWHAGDFGNQEVINQLSQIKPLKGVFGNIDDAKIRFQFPEILRFHCEDMEVMMTHIGGYPKKYAPNIKSKITENPPQIFVSGHSHILKTMYDRDLKLLHFNPGACGKIGWHKTRTMMRFVINQKEIRDLEIIELGKK